MNEYINILDDLYYLIDTNKNINIKTKSNVLSVIDDLQNKIERLELKQNK